MARKNIALVWRSFRGRGGGNHTAPQGTTPHTAASPSLSLTKIIALALGLLLSPQLVAAQTANRSIVHAILFYSPTCPHCHQVINELLIPMQEQYGDQLQIIAIDTSNPAGNALYLEAVDWYEIPQDRRGVPTLIVNDTVLVGSGEIPARFPELVEVALSAGGFSWPDFPGLETIIPGPSPPAEPESEPEAATPAAAEPETMVKEPEPFSEPTAAAQEEDNSRVGDENTTVAASEEPATTPPAFDQADGGGEVTPPLSEASPAVPAGFGLATSTLFGMVLALIYAGQQVIRPLFFSTTVSSPSNGRLWAVPALALIGLIVALYLSYVEVTRVEAVCGPIGECNIVQSSPYARLLGIPVAVLGALSYAAIIILWAGQRRLSVPFSNLSLVGLVAITLFGTGFSVYLTVLESFVIRAVCAWCLSSAVIMTLLLLSSAKEIGRRSLHVNTAAQTLLGKKG